MIGYYICGTGFLVAFIISIVAQALVNSRVGKYSKIQSSINKTGGELARMVAQENFMELSIKQCRGNLTDHYNPKDKSLNLSDVSYNSNSIAGQAIALHELGHAMQDQEKYLPYKVRQFIVKASGFVSKFFMPLLLIGILLEVFLVNSIVGEVVIYLAVVIYGLSFIVNLATLPVEFNASRRAKRILDGMFISQAEREGVDSVLDAAALTYVASTLVSLVYFLRFLYILGLFRRD